MIRIGDFSKLAQVSIRTLRYYDEQGLLKPAYVDRDTGYRHYAVEQLETINQIVALKDLGFTLEQIQTFLEDTVTVDQINSLLEAQEQTLQTRIQQDQQRLERVRGRLQQIQYSQAPVMLDVVLKQVDALWIIGNRQIVPTADDIDFFSKHMFAELDQLLRKHQIPHTNKRMTFYHADEYIEQDFDMEVMIVLSEPFSATMDLPHRAMTLRQLPARELVATTIHKGIMRDVGKTVHDLMQWTVRNGYTFPANNMGMCELFLDNTFETHSMNSQGIVELQIPVMLLPD